MSANPILDNGIDSIILGVEDYGQADPRRKISAVRNFYAGILLLLKARLYAKSEDLISGRLNPFVDSSGGISWKPAGRATVDVHEIEKYWKCLGWETYWKRPVERLQKIRNYVEHHSNHFSDAEMSSALEATFKVAMLAFRDLGTEPVDALGEVVWGVIASEADTARQLASECGKSVNEIPGINSVAAKILRDALCGNCTSSLLRADHTESFPETELKCDACGHVHTAEEIVGEFVDGEQLLSGQNGEDSGWDVCPSCDRLGYSLASQSCLLCGEKTELGCCGSCERGFSVDEYRDSLKFCYDCQRRVEKVMAD